MPPERVPAAALGVSSPSSTPPPPEAARGSGFIPPKLGLPNPRGGRYAEPASSAVAAWLNALVRALRGVHMYAANNARRRELLELTVKGLEGIHETLERLVLTVLPDRILHVRDVVHLNPDPTEGLPQLFHSRGALRILSERGVDRAEVMRFIGALITDFTLPENKAEDLPSVAARLGLTRLRLEGEASATPPRAPLPAPTPREPAPVRLPTSAYDPADPLDPADAPPRLASSAIHSLEESDMNLRFVTDDLDPRRTAPVRLPTGALRSIDPGAVAPTGPRPTAAPPVETSTPAFRALVEDLEDDDGPALEVDTGDVSFSLSGPAGLPSEEGRSVHTAVTEALTVVGVTRIPTLQGGEEDHEATMRHHAVLRAPTPKPRPRSRRRGSSVKKRPR
jgi:hypothetical protein